MYYIWTDGSSSLKTGMCGWAVICFNDMSVLEKKTGEKHSKRVIIYGYEEGTNQKAELLAIMYALKRTPPGAKVFIKTDSEYSINCITRYRESWTKANFLTSSGTPVRNLEIIKELWKLYDARKVTLQHVRGHQGFAGNEAADFIAGLARKMGEGQFDEYCVNYLIKERFVCDSIIFRD